MSIVFYLGKIFLFISYVFLSADLDFQFQWLMSATDQISNLIIGHTQKTSCSRPHFYILQFKCQYTNNFSKIQRYYKIQVNITWLKFG